MVQNYVFEGAGRVFSQGDFTANQAVHEAILVGNLEQIKLCIVVNDLKQIVLALLSTVLPVIVLVCLLHLSVVLYLLSNLNDLDEGLVPVKFFLFSFCQMVKFFLNFSVQ